MEGDLFSILQPFCHRRNFASLSLLCVYFYGRFLQEIHSLVPPVKPLTAWRIYTTSKESKRPHFPCTPFGCFLGHYNLNLFNLSVDRYPSSSSSNLHFLSSPLSLITLTSFSIIILIVTLALSGSQGPVVIYPPNFHNLHFLPLSFSLISNTSFIILILIVTL